jgi:hypothetical protein
VRVSHAIGDDLITVAGRERAGRAEANDVIFCLREERRQIVAIVGQKPVPRTSERCGNKSIRNH